MNFAVKTNNNKKVTTFYIDYAKPIVRHYNFIKGFVAFTEENGQSRRRRLIRKRPKPIDIENSNLKHHRGPRRRSPVRERRRHAQFSPTSSQRQASKSPKRKSSSRYSSSDAEEAIDSLVNHSRSR